MATKIQVRVAHRFAAPPAAVYHAWVDPDSVRVWLSNALKSMGLSGEIAQVRMDPRIGGEFLWSDMRDGVEKRHWGRYLEFNFRRKIVFTWITDESEESDPSTVAILIEPDGQGAMATLVNEIDEKWADDAAEAEKGWSSMLEAIDDYLRRDVRYA